MIGLDTNVIVRFIMQDDARQAAKAAALIESLTVDLPGFVSLADLADCLIERAGASAGCDRIMTFDAGAAKTAGMTLVR